MTERTDHECCSASPDVEATQRRLVEGRAALRDHAADCGAAARARHGPIDAAKLPALLADEFAVRFPTEVKFDATVLMDGEFAVALPRPEGPRSGYVLFVHPYFAERPDALPWLVAYHLVTVNYGDAATAEVAEAFGAALFDTSPDAFYGRVAAYADELAAACPSGATPDCSGCGCGSGGCGG